jgi:hypothetical protein
MGLAEGIEDFSTARCTIGQIAVYIDGDTVLAWSQALEFARYGSVGASSDACERLNTPCTDDPDSD